jgi:hypothetical protein
MRTTMLLGPGIEGIHVTFWQRIHLYFVPVLKLCGRLRFKGDRLINFVKEVLRHHSIHPWV